ncbi:SusC/RagA family TonB-linked outer membrane protein [Sediminitomix flava]|uniref:TonB-linked SusC/RagA family outer membrane protein n=1 Tax=Sediminitomix flava TaxID=379075 RepID=A0A315ZAX8_SEDFL|nr:TonB-dependent receptor [Sediminitomix flava]PWJ42746.1 TonB-linked SusC/RagA family outer membrane protein [Sediminitomix flava]
MKIYLSCIILLWGSAVLAQSSQISGVVKDTQKLPLPGVTIMLKGTTKGVVTGVDGKFAIEAPTNPETVLVFSMLGYQTQEATIGSQTYFDIILEEDVKHLEEVIVTGYNEFDKKKLTGAVSGVDAELIENVPVASFEQMLQGQAPGVIVNSTSGQPGAPASVRIRGTGSINGSNTPLYILDGVPIEASVFASLNPNDFSSVTILKDATATAIYGSRGANGVIVITTKRGKVGRSVVQYRMQYGWSQMGKLKLEPMKSEQKLSYEEYAKIGQGWELSPDNPENSILTNEDLANGITSVDLKRALNAAELEQLRNIDTDWVGAVTQTGITQSHELSMSGGRDNTRFFISGSYFQQEGIAIGTGLERGTGRFNIDHDASDVLRFGLSSSLGFSTQDNLGGNDGALTYANPFANAMLKNPYERIRNPETGEYEFGANDTNPVEIIETNKQKVDEFKGIGSFHLEYEPVSKLKLKSKIGIDYRVREYENFTDPESQYGSDPTITQGGQGSYYTANTRNFTYNWVNTANYKYNINKIHDFDFLLGAELIRNEYHSSSFTGYGLNSKLPSTPASITPGSAVGGDDGNGFIPRVGGGKTQNALLSYFFMTNYAFSDKYTIQASIRRDGSSKFGDGNKWATFWAFGGGWMASEENFMKNVKAISTLKFRLSYGKTGNQNGIGDFQARGVYTSLSYNGVTSIAPGQLENQYLKWEVSNQLNTGFDLGLFADRIFMSVDLYNNITSDLFIQSKLSATAGFPSVERNAGEMRNRGIEMTFETINVQRPSGFRWSTSVNFSYNQNEILDLGGETEFEQGTSIIQVGLPFGTHYTVGWAGVNPANGRPIYTDKDGNTTVVYDPANARPDFGTYLPPWSGGFSNSFAYKGLELSIFFSFQTGHHLFNNTRYFSENAFFALQNQSTHMATVWRQPGDITDVQAPQYKREFSSLDVENASFLRLRNISLSYQLQPLLLQKSRTFTSLRVYMMGQNIYTWTQYTGMDPETGNNIDQFVYPTPRTFTVGLEAQF